MRHARPVPLSLQWLSMRRSRKRLFLLGLGLLLTVLVSTFLYMLGMAALEGKPRGFWQSLEWAGSTLSTTGYGADTSWRHPVMVLFVLVVQFLGVFLVFLIFPIYLIPFLEERFETRLPQEAPRKDLAGHALIYRYGPAVETLLAELAGAGCRRWSSSRTRPAPAASSSSGCRSSTASRGRAASWRRASRPPAR